MIRSQNEIRYFGHFFWSTWDKDRLFGVEMNYSDQWWWHWYTLQKQTAKNYGEIGGGKMFICISNGVMFLPKLPKRKAMNVNLKKLWGVAPCHSTHGAFMLQQCPPKQWNHGVQGINCWGYHHFSKLPQPTFHLPQRDSHPKLCVGIKPGSDLFVWKNTTILFI